jgi:hypothetical protein
VNELYTVEVVTPGLTKAQLSKVRGLADVCKVSYEEPLLRVTCEKYEGLAEEVAGALLSSGAKIRSINTKEPTLEDAFIALTGGEEEIDRFLEKSLQKK